MFRKQPTISNAGLLLVKVKEKKKYLYSGVGTLMLNPAFALVSMNMAPCSCALASPSSVDTFLVHPVNIIEKASCGLNTKIKAQNGYLHFEFISWDVVYGNGIVN